MFSQRDDGTWWNNDLPPKNESSFMLDWKLRKGALNGEKILHAGADYQQTPRG